jgi:hypothetical protein
MTQTPILLPISTSSPMGAWFTELTGKAQMRLIEMVNEEGYPLDDLQEFVEEFGEKYLLDGTYEEWERLSYHYNEDAIRGFIELNGIYELTFNAFIKAYIGQYESGAEYAQECNEVKGSVPEDLVIDWEATWEAYFTDEYEWAKGYVFNRHW